MAAVQQLGKHAEACTPGRACCAVHGGSGLTTQLAASAFCVQNQTLSWPQHSAALCANFTSKLHHVCSSFQMDDINQV